MADEWKVRWEELNDSTVPSKDWVYIWASTTAKSEHDARQIFNDKRRAAASLNYRSVQLLRADALVDEWPNRSRA